MRIHWLKLILVAFAVEIAAILLLVCVVAIFGPQEYVAAQAYAEKMGQWVGPLGGMFFCFGSALWIARSLKAGHVVHGALLGICVALIDILLLVAMRAPFEWIFVTSDLGKLLAATAGGMCAARLYRRRLSNSA